MSELDEQSFAVLGGAGFDEGDFLVGTLGLDGTACVSGFYQGATGNVFARVGESSSKTPETLERDDFEKVPAVRIVGDLEGPTGQVTVLQDDGSYRRFSRWDRIAQGSPAQPDAIVRTLPQCGCGGSIGMPKLFDSFAEMGAYFFHTFYHMVG